MNYTHLQNTSPFALLIALLLVASGCGVDAETLTCTSVEGTVEGISTPLFDDAGTLSGFRVTRATVAGDMAGLAHADFTIQRIDDEGTLHLIGSHRFEDDEGSFLFGTEDEGLTTATGTVENTMTLVQGGTGTLRTNGHVNLENGQLVLDYDGNVCR